MSKVTIILTDTERGNCNIEFHFDPPLERKDLTSTPSRRVCMEFMEFAKKRAESIECTKVAKENKG